MFEAATSINTMLGRSEEGSKEAPKPSNADKRVPHSRELSQQKLHSYTGNMAGRESQNWSHSTTRAQVRSVAPENSLTASGRLVNLGSASIPR